MTLLMLQKKNSYTEIPIEYSTRKGQSKLNVVFHGFEFLWTIVRTTFNNPSPDSDITMKSIEDSSVVTIK